MTDTVTGILGAALTLAATVVGFWMGYCWCNLRWLKKKSEEFEKLRKDMDAHYEDARKRVQQVIESGCRRT